MTIQPAQYRISEVETILAYKYGTICALVAEGILIKHGRGQNARISAASVNALLQHLENGGDLWQAPRMRSARPVAVPMGMGRSGKTSKQADGGPHSASQREADSTRFEPLRRKTLKPS
jgi:hypothetical protein